MLKWHPLAEKFPLLEGAQLDELVASIESTKGCKEQPILFRMVKGKKQGLDGRNRELACKQAKIEPTYKMVNVADDKVKDFILRRNVYRRHMTSELRQVIVAELRADGESTRQIAAALGVDPKTVRNDLAAANGSGGETSPPETVTGNDGKQYPASKPKVLCERCQRAGESKNCPMCAEARKAAAGGKKGKATPEQNDEDGPKDHAGNVLPKGLRDAFLDPWSDNTLEYLEAISEDFRGRQFAKEVQRRAKRLPFIDAEDFKSGVNFVVQYLDNLIDHLKENRLWSVCPACAGNKCAKCKMSGLVPQRVAKELSK